MAEALSAQASEQQRLLEGKEMFRTAMHSLMSSCCQESERVRCYELRKAQQML